MALEHLHRHRAARGIADQAEDDLKLAFLTVATVAAARQRAMPPLQIARRHVVQHQGARPEMAAGQTPFDPLLVLAQPVQRGIQLLHLDRPQLKRRAERVARRRRVQGPGRRQFGRRRQHPGHDQRQRQLMAALLPPRQQRIELDGPCRAERRQHMAVR